jgi:hypothetical protein
MPSFTISGPVITLDGSADSLAVVALPTTTTRISIKRLSGEVISLNSSGNPVLPTTGQIFPRGV